ncbi:hypothetical protein GF337_04865, partial [candidate division KSB1 bacterium]|nr:hypothetical protein [candidate division KSB1 bacterium]
MRVLNFIFIMLVILTQPISAQDIPIFEVADNEALGLTPVLVDRWGCTVADIDRNGYPDIFNAKWRGRLESQIYMNQNGFFTDIYGNSPELSAVEKEGNATRTPVFVDYDNDGDRDLMIGFDKSHHFFRNDDGVFAKITDQVGLINEVPGFVSTYSYEMSAWIDIDLDGDLDGVMFQTNNPSFLVYRNDGDKFTDIAEEVGLADVLPLGSDGDWGYYTGRLQWVDFDNDGDPDLNAGYLMFRNDDGMFTEVAESIGFQPSTDLWFTNWLDFDVDGDMDFIGQKGSSAELWRNDNGIFVEATQDVGLDLFNKPNQTSLNVGDLDNDGDEDVFIQINDWTGDDI